MPEVRVVSVRADAGEHGPKPGETLIRCDRGTPLGNRAKFPLGAVRTEQIAAFDALLDADLARNGPMTREIERIAAIARQEPVAIACWCKPKRCHLDRVKREIDRRIL